MAASMLLRPAGLLLVLLVAGPPALAPPPPPQPRFDQPGRALEELEMRRVGAYEPVQVHLGYTGENAGSVVVQWTTAAMASGSYVQWGSDPSNARRRDAANSTECGPTKPVYPGWEGVLHHARMDGVASRQTIYYRVGSDEQLTGMRSFVAPGYAETEATLLVAADLSTSLNAVVLWTQLRQEVALADALMLAGGTAYAGVSPTDYGTQETWDEFFAQAQDVLTLLPVSVAAGSHDAYSDPPFRGFNLRFPLGPNARTISAVDGTAVGDSMAGFPNWYAYTMGPMRVVVVSTEHCISSPNCAVQDAAAEGAQLQWLDSELGAADAARTSARPWVVVVGHRPLYSSSSTLGYAGDSQLRAIMEPLIFRHGVDLAVWGHTRQYERSFSVYEERRLFGRESTGELGPRGFPAGTGTEEEPLVATPMAGPVHVNVGPGGVAGRNDWPIELPAWTAKIGLAQWSDGGYLRIVGDSACGLTVQYAGLDGGIQDEFLLSKGVTAPIEVDVDLIPWQDRAWDVWDMYEDPGTNWAKVGYSLQRWRVAVPAPLGFGDSPATAVSTSSDAYFFRKTVSLSTLECYDNFTISFQRDDGAVLFVNGYEMLRSNMPSGPTNFITKAATGLSSDDEEEIISITFNASAGHLLPGLNVIAASVHQFGTSNDLRFDLKFAGRKRHPCVAQQIVDECDIARAIAAIVPEPEPEVLPPPPPEVVPEEPVSSDIVISLVTLALCGVGVVGYIAYQVKQCTEEKVEVGKKQKRVREVKVMSAQKEAALLASKMTDARDLSKAGKSLVIAGKDKDSGIKMSYAHAENMTVKAGNVFEGVSSGNQDAWGDLPQQRSSVQFGGAGGGSYQPGGPMSSEMIGRMKKKDLVVELRQRGLPVSGSTPQLQSRLLRVVEEEEKKAAAKAAKKTAKAEAKAAVKAEKKAAKAQAKSEALEAP